jgi:hypothetical protein
MKTVSVGNPKKVLDGKLAGMYACEVYLPYDATEKKNHPIYGSSPTEATNYANRFAEAYLQQKISRIEKLLNEKDIRQKLTEELEWAKQELAKRREGK